MFVKSFMDYFRTLFFRLAGPVIFPALPKEPIDFMNGGHQQASLSCPDAGYSPVAL